MSKKCTLLWRETNFQHNRVGALLEVEVSFCVAGARDCHLAKSEPNVRVVWQFQVQPPLHYATLQYTTLHYTTLHSISLHYATVQLHLQVQLQLQHYSTLQYTTLHELHYLTFPYITLHYTLLHYTTLHHTTQTTATTTSATTLQKYTTPQLQLHYATTTTTAALHPTTSSSCG